MSVTPRSPSGVYLRQREEDNIVCSFGPEYFYGARVGAGVSGLFTSMFGVLTFRDIKRDQRTADYELSMQVGRPMRKFSRWTLVRGIVTQPLYTVGCCCLMLTSTLKLVKLALTHRRCMEFRMDDEDFAYLQHLANECDDALVAFEALCRAEERPTVSNRLPAETPWERETHPAAYGYRLAWQGIGNDGSSSGSASYKRPMPSYMDGVAVGILGTVMDCYLPQKAPQKYLGMRAGW